MNFCDIRIYKENGVTKKISVTNKDRKTDLICGNRYRVEPFNMRKLDHGGRVKPKHIGRIGVLVGYVVDKVGMAHKARIKFDDSGRVGILNLEDLVEA